MIAGQVRGAVTAADRVAAAHRDLLADPDIQFALTPAPPPPKPPAWLEQLGHWLKEVLRPVGRLLRWIAGMMPDAPYARILLWSMIALLAVALIWMAVDRIRYGQWRLPRIPRRGWVGGDVDPEVEWRPDAAPVRRWLEEADALAAAGHYAEAVHHLLFRSVEDIGRRRPGAVRPALTSRELASAGIIPAAARDLFARIARLVERSLFGGRSVDAGDWHAARAAYADFATAQVWRNG